MAMGRRWHIYCHTAPNGKRYIGQTRLKPEKRWGNGNGYRTQPLFRYAIDKYGWDNFKHAVLCSVTSQEYADFLEQWFIKKYDTCNPEHGYNCAEGGAGAVGVKWDEDRKRKRSKSIAGAGNPMFGRHHTAESLERMSRNRKGAENVTPEMREFRTNVLLEANKRRRKPVRQLDMDGNLIATYPGMGELEKSTGYKHSSVWKVCHGNTDQAYGFMWEFEDERLRSEADERRRQRHAKINHVLQYDLNGNQVAVYDSLSDAERKTGLTRDRIGDCCHGGLETFGGYVWKFERPDDKKADGTAVNQLDACGKVIRSFASIVEASKSTGIPRYRIRNCCRGRSRTADGLVFEFQDESLKANRPKPRISVVQLDISGKEMANYNSLTEAMEATGHDRHRISECCQGKRESYRGFKWRYQEESEQPQQGAFLLAEGGNDAV